MKNYNKILEAVNRGIQLALDDFDDEKQVQNIKSKQVQNRDYTKEYLDLMEEVVDLGLPSGTLWCKYNLGVDSNQLSKVEDWYGDYYAWGEIKSNKPEFNWSVYKFGEERQLTKYCYDKQYSANYIIPRTDDLKELQPKDDAAYQFKKCHNYKFHIPTKEQYEELIKYTNNYWVNNYNPNKIIHNPGNDDVIHGLNGRIFKGKNGNSLFIPAAGYRNGSDICLAGSHCSQWSSSLYLDIPSDAYFLYICSYDISVKHNFRCFGFTVRPVINLK